MKILIVEDDSDSRELQHVMLEGSGYETDSTENGKDALALIRQNSYDLIISDILMPVMDGFELCRRMKSDPALANIPFLFYTATYTGKDDRQLARDVGADKYLLKPMPPDDFLAEVSELLAIHTESKQPPPVEEYGQRHASALLRKLYEKKERLDYTGELLHTTEQRYRQIVEALNSHYFFYLSDINGTLKYVSPSAIVILDCANDNELQAMMKQITRRPGQNNASPQGVQALDTNEVQLLRHDDTPCILRVLETPITAENGEIIEYQGIAQDITSQKQQEQERRNLEKALYQAQKMEIIGNMASGIAHDFNNMLMGIIGYADMALQDTLEKGKTSPDMLNNILTAGRRAEKLIQQMLTISRKDEGKKHLVEIEQVINEAISMVRTCLPLNISISATCDPECVPVMANETRLIQLLMNLCVNASHAIGPRGGDIIITAKPYSPEAASTSVAPPAPGLELTIQDNGCGMPRDVADHIFEPYFTTKNRSDGTGLGLAIVHGIVQNHGGSIRVSSMPGKGTTFTIRLPGWEKARQTIQSSEQINATGECIMLKQKVSHTEDIIRAMLALHDWQVRTAISVDEIASLKESAPPPARQIVLVDISQPGRHLGHAHELRAKDTNLPLLLITGPQSIDSASLPDAPVEILKKPFTQDELFDAIQRLHK